MNEEEADFRFLCIFFIKHYSSNLGGKTTLHFLPSTEFTSFFKNDALLSTSELIFANYSLIYIYIYITAMGLDRQFGS